MATYSKRGYKAPKKEQLMIQLKMEMLMKRQHKQRDVFSTLVCLQNRAFC
jgi:hypothetical protein